MPWRHLDMISRTMMWWWGRYSSQHFRKTGNCLCSSIHGSILLSENTSLHRFRTRYVDLHRQNEYVLSLSCTHKNEIKNPTTFTNNRPIFWKSTLRQTLHRILLVLLCRWNQEERCCWLYTETWLRNLKGRYHLGGMRRWNDSNKTDIKTRRNEGMNWLDL